MGKGICGDKKDVSCCRLFLRKLKDTLKIPVLALVDSDPYGLKILSVFMKGEHPHLVSPLRTANCAPIMFVPSWESPETQLHILTEILASLAASP